MTKMTTFAKDYKLTDDEREAIIQAIAKRFRDYVYVGAEAITRDIVNDIVDKHGIRRDDTLTIAFKITQVVDDILVELGSIRQAEE